MRQGVRWRMTRRGKRGRGRDVVSALTRVRRALASHRLRSEPHLPSAGLQYHAAGSTYTVRNVLGVVRSLIHGHVPISPLRQITA